jgi:gluconate 5-dehydrogenase
VDNIEEKIGAIDVLVNNAGINMKKAMNETTDEDLKRILDINLISVFSLSRTCAERMKERQHGSIIMISSMTAVMGIEKVSAYTVAKTGVVGLMRAMSSEYARYGIRINTIAPGWIDTPMSRKAFEGDPARKQKALGRIAAGRFGSPEEIGAVALFLAGDASAYVNMVHLPVDGGSAYHF